MCASVSRHRRKKADPAQNLREATLHLLGAGSGEAPDADELGALGAPAEVIEASEAAKEERAFLVLPENWDACRLFLSVQTQWRYAGMDGRCTGLDYAGVEVVRRSLRVSKETFQRLQIMERCALEYWRSKSNK